MMAELQDSITLVDPNLTAPDGTPTPLAQAQQEKADKALNEARQNNVTNTVLSNPTVTKLDKAMTPLWGAGSVQALASEGAVGIDTIARAIGVNNSLFGIAESQAINAFGESDPSFDPSTKLAEVSDLPQAYQMRLMGAESDINFRAMQEQMRGVMEDKRILSASGASGMAASMAAGIVDIDSLLIPLGGTVAGKIVAKGTAKAGIAGTRIGGVLTGATAGAEAALLVGGSNAMLNNTGDASDIPHMLLSNMALGGVIGGASKLDYDMMDKSAKAADEYLAARDAGFTLKYGSSTAGAAQAVRVPNYASNLRESTRTWFDKANGDPNAMATFDAIKTGRSDITNPDSQIGAMADVAQGLVDKTPLKSLFSDLGSYGLVGSKIAHDLLMHPGGLIVNTRSGALFKEMYNGEILQPLMGYRDLALSYANKANVTIKDKTANMFVTQDTFKQFNRDIMVEMERRYHGDAPDPHTPKEVMDMADAIDKSTERALNTMKGMQGENPVFGSEELNWKSGYIPRKWDGKAMLEHGNWKEIEDALKVSYKSVYGNLGVQPETVDRIVGAIINRSRALGEGIDTNLVGLLRSEGKEYLRDMMHTMGVSKNDTDSFINAITGQAAERSKLGNLKDRIELDLRVPVGNSGKMLLDFVDQDVHKLMHQYAHRVSGTSALARKGYQRGDLTALEEAVVDEANAMGKADTERARNIVKTALSYYGGGPVNKGLSPEVMTLTRLTRMSMLGTMGLTQMGELGSVLATNGWEAVSKHLIPELKAVINGTDTATARELHNAFVVMGKDHILFDAKLALEEANRNPYIQHEYMNSLNNVVSYGERIFNYTSGFNHAMSFSQNLAVASTQSKIYQILSKGQLGDAAYRRMLDLGLDETLVDALQGYISKGVIKDTPEGVQMNFDKWKASDLQDYKLAIHNFTSRMVQKQLAGEGSYWTTTELGRILGQFRTFPLLAFQKQFLRNMKHGDSEAVNAVMYSLMTAGVAYSAAQVAKGNTQNLSPERIAKGAINYSSQIGWMPMAVDPMLAIMGLDDYQFNGYNPYGSTSQGVIPLPPVFPTANKLVRLPAAILGSVNGIDPKEAQVLSATPIIGSMYGFGALFNSLKHD
jgi:hypothetical protein